MEISLLHSGNLNIYDYSSLRLLHTIIHQKCMPPFFGIPKGARCHDEIIIAYARGTVIISAKDVHISAHEIAMINEK